MTGADKVRQRRAMARRIRETVALRRMVATVEPASARGVEAEQPPA
jgi:hypothetical protein